MKKIISILMILFLMVGTAFAGYDEFDAAGEYTHNENAQLIVGYTIEGDAVDFGESDDVDTMIQLNYSKWLALPDGDDMPSIESLFLDMNEFNYPALEGYMSDLFGEDDGYVILQEQYYTTAGAITTTPGAFAMTYPVDEPPEFDGGAHDKGTIYGPYRNVLSYKIVFTGEEWKVLQVSYKMYGYGYLDGEWQEVLVPYSGVSIYKADFAQPTGLGKYKKDNPNKGEGSAEGNAKYGNSENNRNNVNKVKGQSWKSLEKPNWNNKNRTK